MVNALRGIVLSQFQSITDFAKELKWDRKKASRIINQVQRPTADDMEQMASLLHIDDAVTFVHIFFPSIPTM